MWITNESVSQAKWDERISFLSHGAAHTADCEEDELWFSLQLGSVDFEGSFQKGKCTLAYDSLKPGTVAELTTDGTEITTFIPLSSKRGQCILRAYGRPTAEGTAACLFIREQNGKEIRAYWGGNVSDYSMTELVYTTESDGTLFGIRLEKGPGKILVDRIDVYTAKEGSKRLSFDYLNTCITCGNAFLEKSRRIILKNSGSRCFAYLQALMKGKICFEARGSGFAFIEGKAYQALSINANQWQPYSLHFDAWRCVKIGFAIDSVGEEEMEIRKISVEFDI